MAEEVVEQWEREVTAGHRWHRVGEEAARRELDRLRGLRTAAGPLDKKQQAVVAPGMWPEICNWSLFETTPRVCSIIGRGEPDARGTGHAATVTPERWQQIWAYYLA